MPEAPVAPDEAAQRLATEMFLTSAGPALVKSVAEILGAQRIPVMPLKGVLLQRLVYRDKRFRPMSDVDLLVPEARFLDAYAALRSAGYVEAHWQEGAWQVIMRNPSGPPLGIDLHRRLSRTRRSRLTSAGVFARGTIDTNLFGAPVVLPSAVDLFAHLVLHATLDWIIRGLLHRPEDFQAVADALSLDPQACSDHLSRNALVPHALVILPVIHHEVGGAFIQALLPRLPVTPGSTAVAATVRMLTTHFGTGHPARRLAGLALAPSLPAALFSAAVDRRWTRERPGGA